jgi:NAD(P)-dependent dehydrogenase (short-subunit alcohol dehydrogenase family)
MREDERDAGLLIYTRRKQDMTSTDECQRAVDETIKGLGGIDIVIANSVSIHYIFSLDSLDILQLTIHRVGRGSPPLQISTP